MSALSQLKPPEAETLHTESQRNQGDDVASVSSYGSDNASNGTTDITSMLQLIMSRLDKLEGSSAKTSSAPTGRAAALPNVISKMKSSSQRGTSSLIGTLRQTNAGFTPRFPKRPSEGIKDTDKSDSVADDRLAPIIMERLLRHHNTVWDWVQRSAQFRNTRNMHEARRIAQAIDAFRREGVSWDSEGMEILVRNLAGLHKSDEYGDATFLEEMEWAPPESIVPDSVMRPIVKAVKRTKALRPKPNKDKDKDKKPPPGKEGGKR